MKTVKRGDRGPEVKELQEWLNLHDFGTGIDGDFGPATEETLKRFQLNEGLIADGIAGPRSWNALQLPMTRATAVSLRAEPPMFSYREAVVEYARQHLIEHPREVGGQNRGPWVRLYCEGNDGDPWAWCAGFVSYILTQATNHHGVECPIKYTLSCDQMAKDAMESDRLIRWASKETDGVHPSVVVKPGDVFLVYKGNNDWTHTGIITSVSTTSIQTIEGNTNDEGSREGYEVCARTRSYDKLDFIRTDATQLLMSI
tara:strand:- start:2100 stop:2870 length:771 start_codon:yes stop_codon:yes gene_type:complete